MVSNTPDSKGYISLSQIPSTPPPSTDTSAQPTIGKIEGRAAAAPPPAHVKEVAERAEPPAHEQMNEFGEATLAPHTPISKATPDQEGEPPRTQTPNHDPRTERPLSWAPADHYAPTPKSYTGGPIPNSEGVEILPQPPSPAPQPPQVGPSGYPILPNLTRKPPQKPLPPTPPPKASPTDIGPLPRAPESAYPSTPNAVTSLPPPPRPEAPPDVVMPPPPPRSRAQSAPPSSQYIQLPNADDKNPNIAANRDRAQSAPPQSPYVPLPPAQRSGSTPQPSDIPTQQATPPTSTNLPFVSATSPPRPQEPPQENKLPLTKPPGLKPPPEPLPKPPEGVAPFSAGRDLPTPQSRPPGLKPPPEPLPKPPEGVAPFSAGRALPTPPTSVPKRPGMRSASAPPALSTSPVSPLRMSAAQLYEKTQEAQKTGNYDAELHQAIRTKLNDLSADADLIATNPNAKAAYDQLKEANISLSRLAPTQQATPPSSSFNQGFKVPTVNVSSTPSNRTTPPPSLNAEKSKQVENEMKELRTKLNSNRYSIGSLASKILRFGDPKLKLEAELRQKQIEHSCLTIPEAVIRNLDPKDPQFKQILQTLLKTLNDIEPSAENRDRVAELRERAVNLAMPSLNLLKDQASEIGNLKGASNKEARDQAVKAFTTQFNEMVKQARSEVLKNPDLGMEALKVLTEIKKQFAEAASTTAAAKLSYIPHVNQLDRLSRLEGLSKGVGAGEVLALKQMYNEMKNLGAEGKGPLTSHMAAFGTALNAFEDSGNVQDLMENVINVVTNMKAEVGELTIPEEKYVYMSALHDFIGVLIEINNRTDSDHSLKPIIQELQAFFDDALIFQRENTTAAYGPRLGEAFSKIPSAANLSYQPTGGSSSQTTWSVADARLKAGEAKTFPPNGELDPHFDQWAVGKTSLKENEYCGDGLMVFKRGNIHASAVVDADASGQSSAEATAAVLKVIDQKMNQLPPNPTPEALQKFCQEMINEAHQECIKIGKQCTLTFNMYIPMNDGNEMLVGFSLGDAITLIEEDGKLRSLSPDPVNPDGSPRDVSSNGNALGCTFSSGDNRQFNAYVEVLKPGTKVHQASDYTRDNLGIVQENYSKSGSFKQAVLDTEKSVQDLSSSLSKEFEQVKKEEDVLRKQAEGNKANPDVYKQLTAQADEKSAKLREMQKLHGTKLEAPVHPKTGKRFKPDDNSGVTYSVTPR